MTTDVIQWVFIAMGLLIALDVFLQSKDVWGLLRYLRRENRKPPAGSDGTDLPKAAIILALRGPDPRLNDTLRALTVQDYPDFDIRVVVDSEDDPVLQEVIKIQQASARQNIHVSVLQNPRATCSLKCSALIHAVEELNSDVQIVTFIDGDVIPHATWLKELAVPLVNGEANVVGGNRWYLPSDAKLGTLARYLWNVAYMTGMWAQGAPWAGTMAMKRSTIDELGLLQAWSTAMSVDATVHRCMQAKNQKFKLVASVIMTNRESIAVPDFQRWVTRQMAVIRYSDAETAKSAERQIGILLAMHTVMPVVAVTSFLTQQASLGLMAVTTMATYYLICCVRMLLLERCIRSIARKRGEVIKWATPLKAALIYPSVILTHYIIGFGVFRALRVKQVDWRGISYLLSQNGDVLMKAYRPFGAEWIGHKNHSVV